jgi:hypothetical protein
MHILRPLAVAVLATFAAAGEVQVTVDAGARPPAQGTATFPLLPGGEGWALVQEDGTHLPIAGCGDGLGRALIPGLTGERRFRLVAAPAAPALIAIERGDDALRFSIAGRELLAFQGGRGALPQGYDERFRRGGYLARLSTPAGLLVTDDLPPKHQHHHGVWCSWTRTVFDGRTPDFWNMGGGTGGVQAVEHSTGWSAGAWAGFTAVNRYHDLTISPPVAVLEERLAVVMRAPLPEDPVLLVDLTVVHHCLTPQPLILPIYHYGGLGLRGHRGWDGAEAARFLTSEGRTRKDGNATRGRWCHMGGLVDGKPAGIAVLGHPQNLRAPQPLRIHPNEPFLCFAPSQLGDWRIAAGEPLVLRYRLVIADGEPDSAALERRWRDYAEEPRVGLGKKP